MEKVYKKTLPGTSQARQGVTSWEQPTWGLLCSFSLPLFKEGTLSGVPSTT